MPSNARLAGVGQPKGLLHTEGARPQNSNVNVMRLPCLLLVMAFTYAGLRPPSEERAGRSGVLSNSIGPES